MNSDMTEMLKLAHAVKETCDVTDPVTLRETVGELFGESDITIDVDGTEWRFILDRDIDEIMQDELAADPYVLGCFNAWFLASILGIETEVVEAAQAGEGYEALGNSVINGNHIKELQADYVSADGYGHHFAHYDGHGHEMSEYHAFRVN